MNGTKTLTIIKPGAIRERNLGPILDHITLAGFRISALKMMKMKLEDAEGFYQEHRERPFFDELCEFMSSGPIVVAILEKVNAVEDFRKLIGKTDPSLAQEGTIRNIFAISKGKNAVHGSDSDESAERECGFFFSRIERY